MCTVLVLFVCCLTFHSRLFRSNGDVTIVCEHPAKCRPMLGTNAFDLYFATPAQGLGITALSENLVDFYD